MMQRTIFTLVLLTLTSGDVAQAQRCLAENTAQFDTGAHHLFAHRHFPALIAVAANQHAVVDDGHVVVIDSPQGLIDGAGLTSVVRFSTDAPDLSWLEQLEVVTAIVLPPFVCLEEIILS